MVDSQRPFVLIGMEHTQKNFGKILSEARKRFPPGSRVLIEAVQSDIVASRVLETFALGGVLDKELSRLAIRFPPELGDKERTNWLRGLVKKNLALSSQEREDVKWIFNNNFKFQFVCGLIHAGIELVPGDSRYAQGRSGEYAVIVPLREKFFVKRIKKEVPKGIAGGIFGSEHVNRLQKQLTKSGISTSVILVESKPIALLRRLRPLIFPEEVTTMAWWKRREAKKQLRQRKH
jgi:hypothetical protein